jgi:hypothetical protein
VATLPLNNAAFLGTEADIPYLPHLKGLFGGVTTFVCTEPFKLLFELEVYCAKRGVTRVISTNTDILGRLLANLGNPKDSPSLDDYQGSLFKHKNLEIVFIAPCRQLFTVSYGKFLAARFISKLVSPNTWSNATPFKWQLLDPQNIEEFYANASTAFAMAKDIETFKSPLAIRCISFTLLHLDKHAGFVTLSGVLPLTDAWALSWARKISKLPVQKIYQNGKYDQAYQLRFNILDENWLWDTQHFFHATYSELPKDLGFLNAFYLRDVVYWKDLAESNDLMEYYKYNALDGWATINVWIQQMLTAPDYARHNYFFEFPLVYPCLLSELTGIKRDAKRHVESRAKVLAQEKAALQKLQRCLGNDSFNPGSPVQVKQLLKILGCSDIASTEEADLLKAAYRHPLIGFLVELILEIRGLKKLRTTYLRTDEDITKTSKEGAKEFHGFVLYSLNPHGTDSGRLASKASAFWCGFNIQNQPGDYAVKSTYVSFTGFNFCEADLEQAESRDTAYITGDTKLIANVSGEQDFHSLNASAFFGVPYDNIYDQAKRKVKDKPLRTLAKPVNHGANYNMGPFVLVTSMGLPMVYQAAKILKLPFSDPLEITESLLTKFHLTYPTLRGIIKFRSDKVRRHFGLPAVEYKLYAPNTYYAFIANEVRLTNKLVIRAFHHTAWNIATIGSDPDRIHNYIETKGDWTRYCFGKPWEDKLALNAVAAHKPQSLNARTLNEAYMQVFYNVALPNPNTFRLNAQIHDSILFQYAEGHEHLAHRVRECMEIPVTVQDISGRFHTFTVPAALKMGKTGPDGKLIPAKYWSDTE